MPVEVKGYVPYKFKQVLDEQHLQNYLQKATDFKELDLKEES